MQPFLPGCPRAGFPPSLPDSPGGRDARGPLGGRAADAATAGGERDRGLRSGCCLAAAQALPARGSQGPETGTAGPAGRGHETRQRYHPASLGLARGQAPESSGADTCPSLYSHGVRGRGLWQGPTFPLTVQTASRTRPFQANAIMTWGQWFASRICTFSRLQGCVQPGGRVMRLRRLWRDQGQPAAPLASPGLWLQPSRGPWRCSHSLRAPRGGPPGPSLAAPLPALSGAGPGGRLSRTVAPGEWEA